MKTNQKARTGADFSAAHVRETRVPNKIKAVLERMRRIGPEHWEYEGDLTKPPYGLAAVDLAEFRDQFKQHWVMTEVMNGVKPKRVWFADPKVAAKFRKGE